jgi:hypothetical protein
VEIHGKPFSGTQILFPFCSISITPRGKLVKFIVNEDKPAGGYQYSENPRRQTGSESAGESLKEIIWLSLK